MENNEFEAPAAPLLPDFKQGDRVLIPGRIVNVYNADRESAFRSFGVALTFDGQLLHTNIHNLLPVVAAEEVPEETGETEADEAEEETPPVATGAKAKQTRTNKQRLPEFNKKTALVDGQEVDAAALELIVKEQVETQVKARLLEEAAKQAEKETASETSAEPEETPTA